MVVGQLMRRSRRTADGFRHGAGERLLDTWYSRHPVRLRQKPTSFQRDMRQPRTGIARRDASNRGPANAGARCEARFHAQRRPERLGDLLMLLPEPTDGHRQG